MRAVVCAYSEVGHACLDELLELGADVRLVVTHRDSPNETIWFPSVAERAQLANIPVLAPDDINAPETLASISDVRPELLLSFYFRHMMKLELLALASVGALNLHGSLLPRYRGRAPVNWVLINGETETGVTLHYMDEKPDHGDVVAQRAVSITRQDTARSLTRKLAEAGRALLREWYPLLVAGIAPRVPQDHRRSSYFGGRRPEDGAIDWRRDAESIRNLVRALTDPWPGAFTCFRGRRLLVWAAEVEPAGSMDRGIALRGPGALFLRQDGAPLIVTGDGALRLLDVTWEGAARSNGIEWASSCNVLGGEGLS